VAPWASLVWSAGSAPWLAGSLRSMIAESSEVARPGWLPLVVSGLFATVAIGGWMFTRGWRAPRRVGVAVAVTAVSVSLALLVIGDRDPLAWASPFAVVAVLHWISRMRGVDRPERVDEPSTADDGPTPVQELAST
ncbi:MAG: hypothetical protein WBV89_19310, partial [Ilumatobacter sp.]